MQIAAVCRSTVYEPLKCIMGELSTATDYASETKGPKSAEVLTKDVRVPYALRRLSAASFFRLVAPPSCPEPGDIALARVKKIGKNTALELASGRRCALHEGDVLAVVFGNRYATQQFEGYVGREGGYCDLLSMGGLCGLVKSKHAGVAEPTKLYLLGAIADADGTPLHLRRFALESRPIKERPRVIVVCGTAMDVGKTHTVMSLIVGLRRHGHRVAAIKLTGTASGRDAWAMQDAGAWPVLEFVDGGYPSTYLCPLEEILDLYDNLVAHASLEGAEWVVVEIADGLLQKETSALLCSPRFSKTVDNWVFATSDPVAALGGIGALRDWGIEPVAISGLISMSPLAISEAHAATGIECVTALDLQRGNLNARLLQRSDWDGAPAPWPEDHVNGEVVHQSGGAGPTSVLRDTIP
ncbi:MAG: DUF1611 domain-containing protein [Planctomycetes bacterium]|nr:DUF1611 domain-containing protein [Planctomycetota bacterium]